MLFYCPRVHRGVAILKNCAALIIAIGTLVSCSVTHPRNYSEFLLDTTVSITTYDRLSSATIAEVFEYVAGVERRMSTNENDYPNSELIRVNQSAGVRPVTVSPDTYLVVERARAYSALRSHGFEVTIWPLTRIWDFETLEQHERIPTPQEVASAKDLVDYTKLVLYPRRRALYLTARGMGIDVGAIAKGWAADQVAEMLRANGATSTLLDFGGNILLIGYKPNRQEWRVGIQDPNKIQGSYLGVIASGPAAIVSSGDYERFYEYQGVRYHHIIDPATGYPARKGLRSVTIVSENATDADALSTMVYVLGVAHGLALVESLPGSEVVLILEEKQIVLSSGAGALFTLTDENYTIMTH